MSDGDVDYGKYTQDELEQALASIQRQQYPANYAALCRAYVALTGREPGTPAPATAEAEPDPVGADAPPPGPWRPNAFPPEQLVKTSLFSLLLFGYGSYGVWVNDLYIPGKRSRGIHLHDVPAWIMYGAMLCACVVMLATIADHFDQRDNEAGYRRFAQVGTWVGWAMFVLSLLMAVFR